MLWVTNTHGCPGARPDAQEILLQLLARLRIERAERLIHEDEDGLAHQCPRDPDALLHAARELVRIVLREGGEPHEIEEVARLLAPLRYGKAVDLQRKLDVGHHRAPGQQSEALKHHAGVLARRGDLASLDGDPAFVGSDEPGREAQQGGLAAAARAKERDQLALAHAGTDAVERHHQLGAMLPFGAATHGKELADALVHDHRVDQRRFSEGCSSHRVCGPWIPDLRSPGPAGLARPGHEIPRVPAKRSEGFLARAEREPGPRARDRGLEACLTPHPAVLG